MVLLGSRSALSRDFRVVGVRLEAQGVVRHKLSQGQFPSIHVKPRIFDRTRNHHRIGETVEIGIEIDIVVAVQYHAIEFGQGDIGARQHILGRKHEGPIPARRIHAVDPAVEQIGLRQGLRLAQQGTQGSKRSGVITSRILRRAAELNLTHQKLAGPAHMDKIPIRGPAGGKGGRGQIAAYKAAPQFGKLEQAHRPRAGGRQNAAGEFDRRRYVRLALEFVNPRSPEFAGQRRRRPYAGHENRIPLPHAQIQKSPVDQAVIKIDLELFGSALAHPVQLHRTQRTRFPYSPRPGEQG